jgi:MATE family multidrug resistance protein
MFFEVTAFSAATFMMGWISEAHIAAHQAALSLASISFVVLMGVGNSGSIRSATYLGEQKIVGIKNVLFSVVIISLLLSALSAFVFLFLNEDLPFLFVNANESEIVELTSCLLLYAALFQFSDGLQVVFQGLLQGIGDVKIPSIIAISSYWLIGIPLGYLLTFYTSFGYSGVWIGLTVGLTFSAIFQIIRYFYSFKRLLIEAT